MNTEDGTLLHRLDGTRQTPACLTHLLCNRTAVPPAGHSTSVLKYEPHNLCPRFIFVAATGRHRGRRYGYVFQEAEMLTATPRVYGDISGRLGDRNVVGQTVALTWGVNELQTLINNTN